MHHNPGGTTDMHRQQLRSSTTRQSKGAWAIVTAAACLAVGGCSSDGEVSSTDATGGPADTASATTGGTETTDGATDSSSAATTAAGADESGGEVDKTAVPAGLTYSAACDTAPGVTDSEIKLGALVDLSGPTASGGKPTLNGMQQYFDYVNETKGGLNGRTITLEVADTAYDSNIQLSELDAMANDVFTAVLSWGTEPSAAVAPRTNELCMSVMGGGISTSSAELPGHFISYPPYAIEVLNGVDWATKNLEGETSRWAVVTLPGPVGEEVGVALDYAAQEYGIEVVENVAAALSDQDLSPVIAKLEAANPDVILLTNIAPQTPQLLSLYQGDAQIVLFTPAYNPGLLNTPAAEALVDVYVSGGGTPWSSESPGVSIARDWVSERLPEALDQSSFLSGWEGAALIYEGLLRADAAGDLTRGGLARGLFSIHDEDPAEFGRPVTLGATDRPHGVPTLETYILQPDPDVEGTLVIVEEPFVGTAAETYFGS